MPDYRQHHLDVTGAIDVQRLLARVRAQRGEPKPMPVMQRHRALMDPNRLGALVLFAGLVVAAVVAAGLAILLDSWSHP